jgi:hypothetical protein
MKAYKFMNSADVRFWLGENPSAPISRLSYFRLLYGSEWIHDPAENYAQTGMNLSIDRGGKGDDIDRRLREVGFEFGPNVTNITFTNGVYANFGPDYFVFSAAVGDFDEIVDGMESVPPSERYDACVEIADFEDFARCLWETGNIGDTGQEIKGIWPDGCLLGEVRYTGREFDLSQEDPGRADPLVKRPKYAKQHEYRLLYEPKPELGERLMVNFAPPAGLLSRHPWAGKAAEFTAKRSNNAIAQDCIAHLEALATAIRRVRTIYSQLSQRPIVDPRIIAPTLDPIHTETTRLWNEYRDAHDNALRQLYRELRWNRVKSDALDHAFQRTFHPTRQDAILASFGEILRPYL